MLKIFNELSPFFEDVYREISVREYARITKISPPTASKLLLNYQKEGILLIRKQGIYILFRANNNNLFKDLARAYWRNKLSELFKQIHDQFLFKKIILFGSIEKQENKKDSDIDLFVDIPKKIINIQKIENLLNRKIQLYFKEALNNKHLNENIKKGVVIV